MALIFQGVISNEKFTPFECGFDPLTGSRSAFTTRYFMLVIIFLIFDVELSLLFPLVSIHQSSGYLDPIIPLVAVVLLLAGVLHEKNEGSIQ